MKKSPIAEFALETAALAPGLIGTGIVREVVGAKLNPTWRNSPVDKKAYWLDGIGFALGTAMAVIGATMENEVVENLGFGVMAPSLAYLAQNATHDVLRVTAKSTVTAAAPKTVMMTQVQASDPGQRQVVPYGARLAEDF
ncbi:MAG TPA: hypothetical protein VGK74_22240 [Symbiobacteriaceae bacterium]